MIDLERLCRDLESGTYRFNTFGMTIKSEVTKVTSAYIDEGHLLIIDFENGRIVTKLSNMRPVIQDGFFVNKTDYCFEIKNDNGTILGYIEGDYLK